MKSTYLYEQVAGQIEKQIVLGVLKPGDKLPSVRTLSEQQKISLSTAFKAYEELVIKDLIVARDRSGYYVGFRDHDITTISNDQDLKAFAEPTTASKIVSFAQQNLKNKNIVRLSLTAPDSSLLPVSKLAKAMNQALRKDPCVEYGDITGNPDLRRHIARRSLQWKGFINHNEIVITQGCIESIVLCLMAITKPGDTIAISRPTFFSIFSIIQNLGLKALEIDIHPTAGINFYQLESNLEKFNISACVFVTNFNNPTGYCFTNAEKEKLVGMLTKRNVPLIEDDVNGDIYFGRSRPRTCKSFDKEGLVLLCSSFSKTLAPGYRVGWCIPGKFKERFLEIKLTHTVTSASPTQAAMAQFFNSDRFDLHMKKLRKTLHIESIKYRKAIIDYFPKGTNVTKPSGGFLLWVELDKKVNGTSIFYDAIKKGISIWPGQIFSASEGFGNFLRISFGVPFDDKIEDGIRILGNLVRKDLEKAH